MLLLIEIQESAETFWWSFEAPSRLMLSHLVPGYKFLKRKTFSASVLPKWKCWSLFLFLLKAVHYDRCLIAGRQFNFFLVLQLIGNCHLKVLGCATFNTTEHNLHCTHSDFNFLFPDQALSVLSKINSQRVRKVEQIAHNGVEVSLWALEVDPLHPPLVTLPALWLAGWPSFNFPFHLLAWIPILSLNEPFYLLIT